ncbi:MAG: radical SAM protein [Blastocatellia bacterium]|nr:radical SAM protein [Blastocatellia bacterium]
MQHLTKLTVELTNLCNLDCAYCLKVSAAQHLDYALLLQVLQDAKECGADRITFTGGEISLYPHLGETLRLTEQLGYQFALITNGWHFPRLVPHLTATRSALHMVSLSIDAADAEAHDQVRGKGSFQKLMSAVSLCRLQRFPFSFQMVVTSHNRHDMEKVAVLGARLGAQRVRFSHLLPTSMSLDAELSLSPHLRQAVEIEAAQLNEILKMEVSFSASRYNPGPEPPCDVLHGSTIDINCYGEMTLCCQLSDFRHAGQAPEVAANLHQVRFPEAYQHFLQLVSEQNDRRTAALRQNQPEAEFPCHYCLSCFGKTTWQPNPNSLQSGGSPS